jgi:hypothetical protein
MSSLYGSIETLWSKMIIGKPPKAIYEERIDCFKKLIELQERFKIMDKTQHLSPEKDYLDYLNKYKKEYELCELIMKPK